jgi:predicted alpha/beta hydrolase family esterase
LAVVSSDDPFCAPERGAQMAADWGAELLMLGACGHINSASGLGDWPEGRALLQRLQATAAA